MRAHLAGGIEAGAMLGIAARVAEKTSALVRKT